MKATKNTTAIQEIIREASKKYQAGTEKGRAVWHKCIQDAAVVWKSKKEYKEAEQRYRDYVIAQYTPSKRGSTPPPKTIGVNGIIIPGMIEHPKDVIKVVDEKTYNYKGLNIIMFDVIRQSIFCAGNAFVEREFYVQEGNAFKKAYTWNVKGESKLTFTNNEGKRIVLGDFAPEVYWNVDCHSQYAKDLVNSVGRSINYEVVETDF